MPFNGRHSDDKRVSPALLAWYCTAKLPRRLICGAVVATGSRRAEYTVETPGPSAGCRQIEKQEAVDHSRFTHIQRRKEAARGMRDEIRSRHFARQEKSGYAGEETGQQKQPPKELHDRSQSS